MPLIGHGEGRTLGDNSTLNSFGNDSRFAAGIAVACRSDILFLNITGSVQKVMDQKQPVKYEKHSEVVENYRETGGIFCRPARKKENRKKGITKRNTVFQSLPGPYSGPVSSNSVLLFSFLLFLGYPYAIRDGLRSPDSVILPLRHRCTWECKCAATCQAPLQYFITATFEHGNIWSIALGAHQL